MNLCSYAFMITVMLYYFKKLIMSSLLHYLSVFYKNSDLITLTSKKYIS